MNIESLREYCLSLPNVEEKMPFDETILAFLIGGKIFCLTSIDTFDFINLKCDPEKAIALREEFSEITAGYHMNKKHWNSVNMFGNLPDKMIKDLINHSYDLVFKSLTKKIQNELNSEVKSKKKQREDR